MLMLENSLSDLFASDWSNYVVPGLVAFVIIIVLCRYFLLGISKAFEAVCDWLEYKLYRRKVRRVYFDERKKKNKVVQASWKSNDNAPSKAATKKTTSLSSTRKGRVIDAQNVLKRNAEAYAERHKN